MSWHASLISIEHMTVKQFLEHNPEFFLTEHQYKDGWEATGGIPTPFAIGQVGSWLVISDSVSFFFETRDLAASLSYGRRVCILVMEGGSCSHGFQLYVDGVLKRAFMFIGAADDPVVEDEGAKLREEEGMDLLDPFFDEKMFDIWERVTGLSFERFEQTTYQGLTCHKFYEIFIDSLST